MEQTGWRRRHLPRGLAWLDVGENRRKEESLSGIPYFSPLIYQTLPFFYPLLFFITSGLTPVCLFLLSSVGSLTLLPPFIDQAFKCPLVFSLFLFFHSFHSALSLCDTLLFFLCCFVFVLAIFSLLCKCRRKKSLARDLCQRSAVQRHPTKSVGVKHRHRHSLPKRWHHTEANGCRET